MITEGVGITAPMAATVKFTEGQILACYRIAQERAKHRGYSGGNAWKQGINDGIDLEGIGHVSKAERPILIGMMGEYAVAEYLRGRLPGSVTIDTKLNSGGDYGVDLKAYGLTMQVKTRNKASLDNLVRVNRVAGAARVFCFAEWAFSPRSIAFVLGWCWTTNVLDRTPVRSERGDWMNYVVPNCDLLPMCRLADELETWKAAQQWR